MKKLAAFLLLLACAGARADEASYDTYVATVPMSDGVSLDATLYVPKSAAPGARVPLIVRQHGGGSNKDSPFDVKYALRAVDTGHFAALMYSHRGHGNSGGLFDFFGPRTTQDFSEMLDWIAASYGDRIDTNNVGASGYSQGGGESLLPAEHDARVHALAVGNTFADLNLALNPDDAFKFAFATGIFLGAYVSTASRVDEALALRWGTTFYTDTEDVTTPLLPSTTDDLTSRSPLTGVDALVARRVPVFWTNSWEDQLFPGDHPEKILSILEDAGIPIHYWFASGGHAAGDSLLAEEEQREAAMLAWFEQFLRGEDRGWTHAPKVDYWQRVSGDPRHDGEWEHHVAPAWPLDTTMVAFYPQAGGGLGAAPAGPDATAMLVNDAVTTNFANDALTLEVASMVPGMGDILAQVPEGANPLDTVAFTSEPMTQSLDVAGAPVVTVVQDSTRTVVQQFDAKVWDSSDAGAQLIWRGATSGLLGRSTRFALWPNAHTFLPGHRIVLTLSSVDFPTFKPDVEPWASNIVLQGTRVELPATKAGALPMESDSGGGAMPLLSMLALLVLSLSTGDGRGWRAAPGEGIGSRCGLPSPWRFAPVPLPAGEGRHHFFTNSTRRFFAFPASVALSATGLLCP